jgi:hypothetical protein
MLQVKASEESLLEEQAGFGLVLVDPLKLLDIPFLFARVSNYNEEI